MPSEFLPVSSSGNELQCNEFNSSLSIPLCWHYGSKDVLFSIIVLSKYFLLF